MNSLTKIMVLGLSLRAFGEGAYATTAKDELAADASRARVVAVKVLKNLENAEGRLEAGLEKALIAAAGKLHSAQLKVQGQEAQLNNAVGGKPSAKPAQTAATAQVSPAVVQPAPTAVLAQAAPPVAQPVQAPVEVQAAPPVVQPAPPPVVTQAASPVEQPASAPVEVQTVSNPPAGSANTQTTS